MSEEAESARSSKRREGDDRLMNEKDPPPYGAQHRQDALWEGGNQALPPRWHLFELGGDVRYQDDDLTMVSWNRPLPGVRLDDPGDFVVSGWEWHISPQGRSYFVNHNIRTTSWKKPTPERPAGSLTPECIIKGHSKCIWSLACMGTSYNVMSASGDGSIRQWTRDGKPVGKPWRGDGGPVVSIAVSPDDTMAASGSTDGRVRLWNIKKGRVVGDPLEGHKDAVRCLDWSPNGLEIASGSEDGTVRRWKPDTGRQIGPTIETGHDWVLAIKYSPQSDNFATGGHDDMIRVWSKDGKLLIEIEGHDNLVSSLCWSKDGAHIFSGSADATIRKWQLIDGKEVFVLRGHTNAVTSICVSSDQCHLVSASEDYSVRIWDLKTNQQVGDPLLHDDELETVVLCSDGRYIASAGLDKKIYIWSLEAALKQAGDQPDVKLKGRVTSPRDVLLSSAQSKQQVRNQDLSRYGNDTNRTPHSAPLIRPSPSRRRNLFDFLRFNSRPAMHPSAIQDESLFNAQKHAALHGAQRHDEPTEPFPIMVSRVDHAPTKQLRKLPQQYISLSDAEHTIRKVIQAQLENAPPRLLNTTTGLLHNRDAQIGAFTISTQYKELLSFTMEHADLHLERINQVVLTYFRYAMLSHRWEGKEPLLHDIEGIDVDNWEPVGGTPKLQSFCKAARDAGIRWAWSDTCCIDKSNNVELQESVNTMFVWYRHSALTIIYLSDVSPTSKSGALARSAWNGRGWTVQEFLAPKVVRFYQKDWSLYLDDRTPNHKESTIIVQELAHATGIDPQVLVAFQPGMRGAREKLQWASTRSTTWQEDIAYSLFGIFGVHLPVIYGEKKDNALGRLLQEIVARSGDITALDWVGKSSEFNSCLPADITSYQFPPCTLPSPSEDDIQMAVSLLRNTSAVELASDIYTRLYNMSAPRFSHCRLRLPCIVFPVTEVRRRRNGDQTTYVTYDVKANGLGDLQITTEDKLNQFSRTRPSRQALFLVRPWDRSLLELPDFADDTQSVDDCTLPESPSRDSLIEFPAEYGLHDSESHSRGLRLIVHLGQPFAAFLLAQQWGGEYKRIASDHDIIAKVKNMASVRDMMDIRTLEIL